MFIIMSDLRLLGLGKIISPLKLSYHVYSLRGNNSGPLEIIASFIII